MLPTDVGRIHLDRHLPGQLTATVPTRETGDRWGALVLHFARNHTGWRIDQLERLTRPSVARDPNPRPADPKDLDARIRDVEDERRLVDAAHHAATTRLRELRVVSGTKDRQRQVRQQQQTWKRRRAELDHELTHLRTTRGLRIRLADVDRRQPTQQATDLDEGQLERLLGPVPDNHWRQGLRDGLVEEIHAYRRRLNVTATRNILGPDPEDLDHRRDRDELADTLRAAALALGTSPEPDDRNTRCRQQQGHGRDVAAER